MAKRYGVIYVDGDNLGNGTYKRYKKDSFKWYHDYIQAQHQQFKKWLISFLFLSRNNILNIFYKKMKFYAWKGFQNDFVFVTIHIVQHV